MRTLTMNRVRQLDAEHGAEVRNLLCHTRLETVLHEDNRQLLSDMAERTGVSIEELSSYIWLQMYIKELRESFDDIPSPAIIARQFSISFNELDDYVCGRDLSMTAEERRDYLEDLQEDAGLQGD